MFRSKWTFLLFLGMAAGLASILGAQQQSETIVRNGLIVTSEGRMEADIRIRGEKIAEIRAWLPAIHARLTINALNVDSSPSATACPLARSYHGRARSSLPPQ